jgi:hypothetical protein
MPTAMALLNGKAEAARERFGSRSPPARPRDGA